MARKFYPSSRIDRALFWTTFINIPFVVLFASVGQLLSASIGAVLGLLGLLGLYLFQDEPPPGVENEYSAVIGQIAEIEKILSGLSGFLEKERQRVADTEGVLKKLNDEKTKLEPIVKSQRETVEAILGAHARRSESRVWKERVISFFLGLLASMLASTVYNLVVNWTARMKK